MHLLSSDVQMGLVLASAGNVMERMTARTILTNRIVVISMCILQNMILSIFINSAVLLKKIHFSTIAS